MTTATADSDPVFAAIAEFRAAEAAYADASEGEPETAAYVRLLRAVKGLNVAPTTRMGAAALLRFIAANYNNAGNPHLWGGKWAVNPEDPHSADVASISSVEDILETVAVALEGLR